MMQPTPQPATSYAPAPQYGMPPQYGQPGAPVTRVVQSPRAKGELPSTSDAGQGGKSDCEESAGVRNVFQQFLSTYG